ncbi:MAG: acetate kinase [Nanoarchaeota archaeon]|nr:acetate kinase [Nanoarchaeota archaeon]MBU1322312.1 acetate kinase [Nanoarchaeota archaeon]MBU1597851.1 acetate kinase [Nanoarchaeota archaeon]MBU2441438.1 acetate kinase [Nanoarchaeota archaeon]
MKILVLNSGSSSLKYKLFDMNSEKELISGHVDGIGLDRCVIKIKYAKGVDEEKVLVKDHVDAVMLALKSLKDKKIIRDYSEINAIGHRVVHGGENYSDPVIIDSKVIHTIKELFDLAPLHNPPNLAGILACRKMLPKISQVAVFDTAFHQSLPKEAYLYGLPYELYEKFKIRKYGFHGTSHKYVAKQAINLLGIKNSRIITCHLGNGCSLAAVLNGKSIETSMGLTPLEGLIMGTRAGSLDPAIPVFLIKDKGFKPDEVDKLMNKNSGLLGISGLTSDLRDLHKANLKGNKKADLALQMFAHRTAFYIGGYMAILGGLDALVFTAGIGEGAWHMRRRICNYLESLGIELDLKLNRKGGVLISKPDSKVKVYVIPTNEELQIARETKEVVGK